LVPKDEGEERKTGHSVLYDMEREDLSGIEAELVGVLLVQKKTPRQVERRPGWVVRELILFRIAFGPRVQVWFQFDPQVSRAEEMPLRD
jgi:hypothetical protein